VTTPHAAREPLAFEPSPNVADLRESATIAVSARAKHLRAQGRRIIDLGAGEPDFDTPEFIRRAAQLAIEQGATRYTLTEGILPLREAIAENANRIFGGEPRIDPADVVAGTGSKQALFNACFTIFGPGDDVLIPAPSWTSYREIVRLARANPVSVWGDAERGLKVSADALARAATPATRGIILNSPCNPTGSVYSADELRAMLELADARGWWVVSDEIYRRITYDVAAPSLWDVARARDRLIVVDGVAKSYAMTGWRIGWAIAPRAVASRMTALQSHTTSNPSSVSQHAALAAVSSTREADDAIHHMVGEFRKRRDAACVLLQSNGVPFIQPDGAFYLFLRVDAEGTARRSGASEAPGSLAVDHGAVLARRLIDEYDVAVVPGSAFGAPAWVRVSYAAPAADVSEGLRRLLRALKDVRSADQ
jgi:aspartate aminotransferase